MRVRLPGGGTFPTPTADGAAETNDMRAARASRFNPRVASLSPSLAVPPSLLPLSGYLRIVTLTALRREIIELSEEWEKMSEAAGRGVGGE